jgi:hypothetical protein
MQTDIDVTDPTRHETRNQRHGAAAVIPDLWNVIALQKRPLMEVIWSQHQLHEARRWDAVPLLDAVDLASLSDADKIGVRMAGQAELTTKPGADRLAHLADVECRRWQGKNDPLATVMQALGTWSRYWNEEEAYHEISFDQLTRRLGLEATTDEMVLAYRQIFPDDDMLRTLVLLAISEIQASVNYASAARMTQDPGLKAIFKHVGADEVQHMTNFVSFAKALVDSGEYRAKDAFAVAHFFVREDGELQGSRRHKIEERNTHVNWWDHIDDGLEAVANYKRKVSMVCNMLDRVTGLRVDSAEAIEETWMELVGC